MKFVRNVEVWVFGAFGALVAAACLDGSAERAQTRDRARTAAQVEQLVPAGEIERAEPAIDAMQPMYTVYVVGKRPSAAEKRAMRADAG